MMFVVYFATGAYQLLMLCSIEWCMAIEWRIYYKKFGRK